MNNVYSLLSEDYTYIRNNPFKLIKKTLFVRLKTLFLRAFGFQIMF
jgi:hypothetical protein